MSTLLNLLAFTLFLMTSLSPMTSSATQYVAEVRVYVDQSGYNNWVKATGKSGGDAFREEMNSTFFEMNEILKTLEDYNVNIQLQISYVRFLNRNILTTRSGKIVNSESLKQFENWMGSSYSNNPYDLAILFTGFNLVDEDYSDKSVGYAYIGTACSATALGVVELRATYNDVLTGVHEIGHILGAEHDGKKEASGCNSRSGKIMNPLTDFSSRNHFFFSSCSASMIKNTLNKLNNDGKNCMNRWYYSGDITGPSYGSLVTPDQVCKRKYGSSSYIARMNYASYGDNVCSQLACMTQTVGTQFSWKYEPTPQGLNCGKMKQCFRGRCVLTSDGDDRVSDSCPFGDQPKIEGSYQMTCNQLTSSQCSNWKKTCCMTCGTGPGTADEVCQEREGYDSSMARRAYSSYGNSLCSKLACLTKVTGTHFYWSYDKAPDGMKCGKKKRCSNGQCVSSNSGDPNMSDACPFGDQPWLAGDWQTTCKEQIRKNGCSGQGWNETCCSSCYASQADPGTADQVCRNLVGSSSAMARRAYSSYGNNLCSQLACLTKVSGTTFYWRTYKAPDGMKCGKNKRCFEGKCQWSGTGDPNMSDSCPYGDQPWLAANWRTTCNNYIKQNGCGGRGWKQICCSSC